MILPYLRPEVFLVISTEVLKVELEYWLPGITMWASGDRQPVDISIK